MRQVFVSVGLLCVCLFAAVALHSVLARACKAVVWARQPLASGEHEAFGYERRVYNTAEPAMQQVVALVLAAGAAGGFALLTGQGIVWLLAVAVLAAAVVLDLRRWERVSATATTLWFQRGLTGQRHRVAIDDIRDLAVDEEDARGPTLRNLVPGLGNTVCRLRVRLDDKRVLSLPMTDAARGLADVEAVANHIRLRKQQAADRKALHSSEEAAGAAVREALLTQSSLDKEMAAELQRLRRKALAPDLPPPVDR